MTEKEIRQMFPIVKVDTQMEFDRILGKLKNEQLRQTHPLLDRERELAKSRELLLKQKSAIDMEIHKLNVESIELEQKRKDINRVFEGLKHELIMLNPKECFPK